MSYGDVKPIYIVGNGPSQNKIDLDKLQHPSYGCNLINRIYDKVAWRPDRWYWGDHPQKRWQLQEIFDYVATYPHHDKRIRNDIVKMLVGTYRPFGDDWPFYDRMPDGVTPWVYCIHHNASYNTQREPAEIHFPRSINRLCKPGTTVEIMMMAAIKEGYNEIRLIGCDAGFAPAVGGVQPLDHMVPGYYGSHVQTTQEQADGINRMILHMHRKWEAWSKENGIKIYNVEGAITAHEQVQFNDLT